MFTLHHVMFTCRLLFVSLIPIWCCILLALCPTKLNFVNNHVLFWIFLLKTFSLYFQVIYVLRNPKDILISYYSFLKMLTPLKFEGTFEEFCDRFTKDKGWFLLRTFLHVMFNFFIALTEFRIVWITFLCLL